MLLMGLAVGGAATSHTLMLPSPHEDTRIFSFSCQNWVFSHAQFCHRVGLGITSAEHMMSASSCMHWFWTAGCYDGTKKFYL